MLLEHNFLKFRTFCSTLVNIGLSCKITKLRTSPVLVSRPKQAKRSQKRIFGFTVYLFSAKRM